MYRFVYWFKMKDPHPQFSPVILVTGCSSGIGQAIAQLLANKHHYRVVLTARAESLPLLQKQFQETERLWLLPLDVADAASRAAAVQAVLKRWGGVDILVNNAGISYRSTLEDMSDADEHLQMETNYHGPVDLIRHVLPAMREKGRGKIINISSVSGMLAMPTMASYSASKHALEGASEALWYESRPFGISVSLLQPGFVRSDSFTKVRYSQKSRASSQGEGPYGRLYQSMAPFIAKLMARGLASPESIATLVLHVVRTQDPPLWIPASYDAEFFYYLRRLFPRRLLHPFLYRCLPQVHLWGDRFTHRRHQAWWPFRSLRSWWQKDKEKN